MIRSGTLIICITLSQRNNKWFSDHYSGLTWPEPENRGNINFYSSTNMITQNRNGGNEQIQGLVGLRVSQFWSELTMWHIVSLPKLRGVRQHHQRYFNKIFKLINRSSGHKEIHWKLKEGFKMLLKRNVYICLNCDVLGDPCPQSKQIGFYSFNQI